MPKLEEPYVASLMGLFHREEVRRVVKDQDNLPETAREEPARGRASGASAAPVMSHWTDGSTGRGREQDRQESKSGIRPRKKRLKRKDGALENDGDDTKYVKGTFNGGELPGDTADELLYESQRDNETSYDSSEGKQWGGDHLAGDRYFVGDRMCQLTSIAMVLATMAGSRLTAKKIAARILSEKWKLATYASMADEELDAIQLEDILDVIIQKYCGVGAGSGARENSLHWEWLIDLFGQHKDSNVADSHFMDGSERAFESPQAYMTQTLHKDPQDPNDPGKTIVQLLAEGHQFILRNTLPGGGHIVALKSVEADGLVINDPFGLNFTPIPDFDFTIQNEVADLDRRRTLYKLQQLLGWKGNPGTEDATEQGSRSALATGNQTVQQRLKFSPGFLQALGQPEFFYCRESEKKPHPGAPLVGNIGESVFYSWAECTAVKMPSRVLDTKGAERKPGAEGGKAAKAAKAAPKAGSPAPAK